MIKAVEIRHIFANDINYHEGFLETCYYEYETKVRNVYSGHIDAMCLDFYFLLLSIVLDPESFFTTHHVLLC